MKLRFGLGGPPWDSFQAWEGRLLSCSAKWSTSPHASGSTPARRASAGSGSGPPRGASHRELMPVGDSPWPGGGSGKCLSVPCEGRA